jgi:predicted transposase YdaD
MYDLLRETPAYQHIKKEGLLEGLERGRKEGKKEAGVEALRQTLQHVVAARFPKLARGQSMVIDDPKELDSLIVKISLANNIEEAKNCLIGEDSNN